MKLERKGLPLYNKKMRGTARADLNQRERKRGWRSWSGSRGNGGAGVDLEGPTEQI